MDKDGDEDEIARWAARTPAAVALYWDAGPVTYGDFDAAINQVAWGLGALNLPPSGLAAVRIANLYGFYLVDRALARLGLTVTVLGPEARLDTLLPLLGPDVFLTDSEVDLSAHPAAHLISSDWMRRILAGPRRPPPPARARSPEDRILVATSSGTTGTPKTIAVTRRTLARRFDLLRRCCDLTRRDRAMICLGPSTAVGYYYRLYFWSLGAGIIPETTAGVAQRLGRFDPTFMLISPVQLGSLMAALPAGARPRPPLHVVVTGGRLSRALAAAAEEKLTPRVSVLLGSAEVGMVAAAAAAVLERREGAVGFLIPTVEAQVLDAEGVPAPPERMGVLRIKAEGLFEGYLDDETATAAALRDGWFYPGDLAILGEDGLLSIEGRVAEFMNLGGVKIAPPAVDEAALACPGVLEAAAFSVPDAQGIEQPWIAVVRGEGFAERALIDALDARWPALRRTRIAFIDRIPRNAMGKPERQKLKAIINEALPRLAAAQPGPEAPKFPESLPPTAP